MYMTPVHQALQGSAPDLWDLEHIQIPALQSSMHCFQGHSSIGPSGLWGTEVAPEQKCHSRDMPKALGGTEAGQGRGGGDKAEEQGLVGCIGANASGPSPSSS